jgi:sugar phosphate isomerase/epimerase
MRLGFFTNAYRHYPLAYALRTLSDYGYQGIELWAKGEHITPFDSKDRWQQIKEDIAAHGLEVFAVSAHLDFVAPRADKRKEQIERFIRVLDMAEFFGVAQVHTASGGLYQDMSFEQQAEYFVQAMQVIGPEAESKNIRIGLEPEPEKWLSTPGQVVRLIEEELTPGVFGVVVDLAHADGVGENPVGYINRVAPYLLHIHLDDVHQGMYPHRHLIPGEGCIDYREVFSRLRELGYGGWLSVELNRHIRGPAQAARLACQFIQQYRRVWADGR